MTSAWIALCDDEERDGIERSLREHDGEASLSFASGAQELRQWAQESQHRIGVVVGPLSGALSSMNVAAAIARDDSAREVALATHDVSPKLEDRARAAGISHIVDLSLLEEPGCELDEPTMPSDEVPTMLFVSNDDARHEVLRSVPKIDTGVQKHGPNAVPASAKSEPEPSALQRRGPVHEGSAPIVALFSGRGGVGKTSLVATMAQAAATWGMRVALCDLDLSFGNLYSCFGLPGPVDLLDGAGDMPSDEAGLLALGREVPVVGGDVRLWGPCILPETSELVSPHVERLLNTLASHHDLVVVDTSVAFNDATAQVAQQCDRMVLVADGRPGTNAAQARLGALAVRLGVARTRIACLSNRCGARGRGATGVNRAEVGLETARDFRVADGGAEVSACIAEGNVGELFELGSRFVDSTAHALAQLLAELGVLPEHEEAKRALERKEAQTRWTFGRRREAM